MGNGYAITARDPPTATATDSRWAAARPASGTWCRTTSPGRTRRPASMPTIPSGGNTWYNNTSFMNGTQYNMLASPDPGDPDTTITLTGALAHIMRNNIGYPNKNTNMGGRGHHVQQLGPEHHARPPGTSPASPTRARHRHGIEASARSARAADGSMPTVDFLHLAAGSKMIDKGTNVSLAVRRRRAGSRRVRIRRDRRNDRHRRDHRQRRNHRHGRQPAPAARWDRPDRRRTTGSGGAAGGSAGDDRQRRDDRERRDDGQRRDDRQRRRGERRDDRQRWSGPPGAAGRRPAAGRPAAAAREPEPAEPSATRRKHRERRLDERQRWYERVDRRRHWNHRQRRLATDTGGTTGETGGASGGCSCDTAPGGQGPVSSDSRCCR